MLIVHCTMLKPNEIYSQLPDTSQIRISRGIWKNKPWLYTKGFSKMELRFYLRPITVYVNVMYTIWTKSKSRTLTALPTLCSLRDGYLNHPRARIERRKFYSFKILNKNIGNCVVKKSMFFLNMFRYFVFTFYRLS